VEALHSYIRDAVALASHDTTSGLTLAVLVFLLVAARALFAANRQAR
jgi:hypothetical protein